MNKSRKDELPEGKDGRKMDYAYICTKIEDADWDFLIKHTHSYARGMAIVMARRHYQHKDIHGTPMARGRRLPPDAAFVNVDLTDGALSFPEASNWESGNTYTLFTYSGTMTGYTDMTVISSTPCQRR